MKILILFLFPIITVNGLQVSLLGISVLQNASPDTEETRNSAFWANWFQQYTQNQEAARPQFSEGNAGNSFGGANSTTGFETDRYCIYDLHMSYIYGAPDGVVKRIIGFNGQFPGPTLRCTRKKWLVVRVTNSIEDFGEPVTIHWHGIEQNLSPFYDGPESITQCPIIKGTSMIYKFELFQSGTYWYHSHHSYQYVDGAWGFLVIKNTPEVYQKSYDDELTISVNDWIHRPAKNLAELFLIRGIFPTTNSSLINGQGTFDCTQVEPGFKCDPNLQAPAVINVVQGKRYRLRILNSSGTQTYNFSIDYHKMVAIETDGVDTFPSPSVDIVSILPAQRYSLLVTMNQGVCEYWIRIRAGGAPGLQGLAILRYRDCTPRNNFSPGRIEVAEAAITQDQAASQARPDFQDVPWAGISARGGIQQETPAQLREFFPGYPPSTVSRQFEIETEHRAEARNTRLPTTTPVDPNTAVVLDQMTCVPYKLGGPVDAPKNFDQEVIINVEPCRTTESPARLCMNGLPFTPGSTDSLPVLFQVIRNHVVAESYRPLHTPTLNKVVRLIVNNRHPAAHPWHLHGHTFWVLGAGPAEAGDYVPARDSPTLNFRGVRRDTTFTNRRSWLVLAYKTDNPGTWFFHCHINWHLQAGLGATLIEAAEVAQQVYARPPLQSYLTCRAVGVEI